MKIVHIVDYLMPTMGYQEFILPKFNAFDKRNSVYIITGNKYYPVPNYDSTWKKFLGNRKNKLYMDGYKVFQFSINRIPKVINETI